MWYNVNVLKGVCLVSVDKMIDSVLEGIDDKWDSLCKIRYIYLAIGKFLSKNVDFFFSIDKKLGELNLSLEKIGDIYNSEYGSEFSVICRSGANILKKAYERVGIKTTMVKTVAAKVLENGLEIYHYFLAAYDEKGNAYFLTIIPDIANIKMGFQTEHFAGNIPYERVVNGENIRVYQGLEIKPTLLDNSELKKIDDKINCNFLEYQYSNIGCYCKKWLPNYNNAALWMVRDCFKNNKLYYEMEIYDTKFYKSLISFTGDDMQIKSFNTMKLNEFSHKDFDIWIKKLCKLVVDKINNVLGDDIVSIDYGNVASLSSCKEDNGLSHYAASRIKNKENLEEPWSYDEFLKNLCVSIQDFVILYLNGVYPSDFSTYYVQDDFLFSKWAKRIRKNLKGKNNINEYDDLLAVLEKMNSLVQFVKSGKVRDGANFRKLFNNLAYHFINPKHIYENSLEDDFLSSYYIASKFYKMFPFILGCDSIKTDFNRLDYAEQIAVLREIVPLMFPEVNMSNSWKIDNYNDRYNAIENRINFYPVKDKKSLEYLIVFNIVGVDDVDYYFIYDMKNNSFDKINILELSNDYVIISLRFKSKIEEMENIESKRMKKTS